MKLLKTFFGQVLRKTDRDFNQQSSRDGVVLTHIDYSNSTGGVVSDPVNGIQGLMAYVGANNVGPQSSIYVTPGVFYNSGSFSQTNSLGGGERGQIFTQQIFSNLPYTYPLTGGQPTYLVVYVKTIGINYNPDPHQSQSIVTSRDVITNENVPTRQYTTGYLVVSDPIAIGQLEDLGGIPLALVQTDRFGNIVSFDTSVRSDYVIGGSVDLLIDQIVDAAVPDSFFTTDHIADNAVLDINFADSIAVSSDIAVWDGSSTSAILGSGVANSQIKGEAIFSPQMSVTGSMNGFSATNYLSNSSFENNGGSLTSWNIYSTSSSATAAAVNTQQYFGSNSARLQGVILGQNPAVSQTICISQIATFNGGKINNQPLNAFFYLSTDSDMPTNVSGVTGLFGTVEFMSAGNIVSSPQVFASYSGVATNWIQLQSTGTISYSGTGTVDSARFSISGSIGNVNAYVDGAFLGLTNLLPEWSPAAGDFALGNTLNINNVNVSNLLNSTNTAFTNTTGNIYSTNTLLPSIPNVTTIGSPSGTFSAVETNSIYVSGLPLNLRANCAIFTGNSQFVVPNNVSSIVTELYGGGGGGSAGADEQGWTGYGWGGAGGSGGWSVKTSIPVNPGDTLNIIIGSGGIGGQYVESPPYYHDYFRVQTGIVNGLPVYNNGSRGQFGGNTQILDSNMNLIIAASGGMGGWGPWGTEVFYWLKNNIPSAPTTYTGSSFFISGNAIYIQGTYGLAGWGIYNDYLNLGQSTVNFDGGTVSGGNGGSLGIADVPSIGGVAGQFSFVNTFGGNWPQGYRPAGNIGSFYGSGGGGGAGGYGTTISGAGGNGGNGAPGLVRIFW